MTQSLVLVDAVLALVLVLSGAAKLGDRQATEDMFVSLRVPTVPPAFGARALPWAELGLGVLLLVAPPPLLVPTSAVVLLLFLVYLVLIARATTFDPPVSCACFGKLGGHRVGRTTVVRNALLVVLGAVALVGALDGSWWPGEVADLDRTGVAWLAVAVVTAVLAWLVARTDEAQEPEATDLEYTRLPIPYGLVQGLEGGTQSLRELAKTRARLLVFLSPGCSSCTRTAERLDAWAQALGEPVGVHALYTSRVDASSTFAHDPALALHEPERNVTRSLGIVSTPAAVLLGADGLLAGGPVSGEGTIAEMVEEMLDELSGFDPAAHEPAG